MCSRWEGWCHSVLCLLRHSLAAGDSSNPSTWELSPVYIFFYIKDLCPTCEVPLKDNEVPLRTSCLFLQAEELKMDLESYKKGEKVHTLLSCLFSNHHKNLSMLLVAWVGVGSTGFSAMEALFFGWSRAVTVWKLSAFVFFFFWLLLSWSFG